MYTRVFSIPTTKNSVKNDSHELVSFTPHIAKYVLENNNEINRDRKNDQVINDITSDILNNRWRQDHPTSISFGWDDTKSKYELIDGQGRLMACVRADKDIITKVSFYHDTTLFKLIDTGRSRSDADRAQTSMGIDKSIRNKFVETARYLMIAGNPKIRAGQGYSKSARLAFFEEVRDVVTMVVSDYFPSHTKGLKAPVRAGFVAANYNYQGKYQHIFKDRNEFESCLKALAESFCRASKGIKTGSVEAEDVFAERAIRAVIEIEKGEEGGSARDPIGLARAYLTTENAIDLWLSSKGKTNRVVTCYPHKDMKRDNFPKPKFPLPRHLFKTAKEKTNP